MVVNVQDLGESNLVYCMIACKKNSHDFPFTYVFSANVVQISAKKKDKRENNSVTLNNWPFRKTVGTV